MKILTFISFLIITITSCNVLAKRVQGNGNITTLDRSISSALKIECAGSYDVQLTQGAPTSLKIEADENLQPYISADMRGDVLLIHTEDDVNLSSSKKIKVYITTDKLEEFKITGAGDVTTTNQFTGADYLNLGITGSGNIHFNVNTPRITSSISGSGDIYLTGETKDSKTDIAGSGNYHADDLKAENATIKIAGVGDAHLFANSTLNITIAGVGNVYYKGNPSVTQDIAGSGKVKKME